MQKWDIERAKIKRQCIATTLVALFAPFDICTIMPGLRKQKRNQTTSRVSATPSKRAKVIEKSRVSPADTDDTDSDDDNENEEENEVSEVEYDAPDAPPSRLPRPMRNTVVNPNHEETITHNQRMMLLTDEIRNSLLTEDEDADITVEHCLKHMLALKNDINKLENEIKAYKADRDTHAKQLATTEREVQAYNMMVRIVGVLFQSWKFVGTTVTIWIAYMFLY